MDNSLLGHSITHETGWISTGPKKWGGIDIETGYAARVCVHEPDDASEVYRNTTFMPGLASLAKRGLLDCYTSAELEQERFRQPTGRFQGYGWLDHGFFRDIRMRSVDGHAPLTMGPAWMNLPNSKEQQQKRLAQSDDPLYAALVEKLGQKNNLDAWHICTAERHGLFCFLTMDFRLKNLVAANSGKEPFASLRTRVMTPEDLGDFLGIRPIAPKFFSYHGASWPVRPDLHWPTNSRRPKSSYRRPEKE
ncbi:hypothetical protein HB780_14655 [Rhizobium lusitanum]|uniref:hypothetical protein n=1 Tax=Rhizobium lusitanum TaxID=293958 RepID=UPI00160D05B9|nr:hypothetical protein [Rhizobium lusitanum]QND46975.1 hypothetical protein HB780_14655 [Rhizobium lusitanum]